MKKLTIYLNKRLPDLKKIPEEYDNYGRFGIDNKDNYFFSTNIYSALGIALNYHFAHNEVADKN